VNHTFESLKKTFDSIRSDFALGQPLAVSQL
jgi:hypothetical protein